MSHTTEIETLEARIQAEPEILAFLNDLVEDAEIAEAMRPLRLGDPLSASLSLVAAAALWKLLSVGIDTLRRMSEAAAVERWIELLRELQEMGYQRQADVILKRLFEEIRKRPADDSVLKKLTRLL